MSAVIAERSDEDGIDLMLHRTEVTCAILEAARTVDDPARLLREIADQIEAPRLEIVRGSRIRGTVLASVPVPVPVSASAPVSTPTRHSRRSESPTSRASILRVVNAAGGRMKRSDLVSSFAAGKPRQCAWTAIGQLVKLGGLRTEGAYLTTREVLPPPLRKDETVEVVVVDEEPPAVPQGFRGGTPRVTPRVSVPTPAPAPVSCPNLEDRLKAEAALRVHSGMIWKALNRFSKMSQADRDDAFQIASIQVYLHVDKFHGRSKMSTWMHRVATNAALMVMRNRKRKTLAMGNGDESEVDLLESQGEWGSPADVLLERAEEARELAGEAARATALLGPNGGMFLAAHVDDRRLEDIALENGLTESAVRTRLHRVRHVVREKLRSSSR